MLSGFGSWIGAVRLRCFDLSDGLVVVILVIVGCLARVLLLYGGLGYLLCLKLVVLLVDLGWLGIV